MKVCPKCKREFPDKINFCGACGVSLVSAPVKKAADKIENQDEVVVEKTKALDLDELKMQMSTSNKKPKFDNKTSEKKQPESKFISNNSKVSKAPESVKSKNTNSPHSSEKHETNPQPNKHKADINTKFSKQNHHQDKIFNEASQVTASFSNIFSTLFKNSFFYFGLSAMIVFLYMGLVSIPYYLYYATPLLILPILIGLYVAFFNNVTTQHASATDILSFMQSGSAFWDGFLLALLPFIGIWISFIILFSYDTVATIIGSILLATSVIFLPIFFGFGIFVYLENENMTAVESISKGLEFGSKKFGNLIVFSIIITSVAVLPVLLWHILTLVALHDYSIKLAQFFRLLEILFAIFGLAFFVQAWVDKYLNNKQ